MDWCAPTIRQSRVRIPSTLYTLYPFIVRIIGTFVHLVDVHERAGGVGYDVLVADGEDCVLPVDGHEAGIGLQHDVRMGIMVVPGKEFNWSIFVFSQPDQIWRIFATWAQI